MRQLGSKFVLLTGMLGLQFAFAQVVHQVTPVDPPTGSYIAFKFDWDQGRPWLKYSITVDDAGNAHFEGVGNPIDSGDGDEFAQDFTMSAENRQKIFDLAKKADYFRGNIEAKQKNIAKTGQKTLKYHSRGQGAAVNGSATYNYSPNPDIQELTRIFQATATTLDFGRKLAFQSRFDKLGIDATLHSLQELQASHFIEELQAIEPILQRIASDPNMMHINRVTAKQLLNSLNGAGARSQAVTQP